MEIYEMTAALLAEKIKQKEIGVKEAVQASLDQIAQTEPTVDAFITVTGEQALARAEEVQKKIDAGELQGPLAGVPIAVKDNICTKGVQTTAASKILEGFVPTYEATVCEHLEKAGTVIVGKTNMDEFAMGSTSETSHYKLTKNPADPERVPGGSSGGSAAAVASFEVPIALGSDTGGSIRQPAAYCGCVGIKPTYGTVSRYGLIAYASSLDQIGPFGRTVEDAVLLLDAVSAYDGKDSTSVKREEYAFAKALQDDVKGMRIGLPSDYFGEGLDPEIRESVMNAAKLLEKKGAVIEEFSLGMLDYVVPTYYVVACTEASSNLSRFDGVKYGYRTEQYNDLHDMYKKTRSEGFGAEVQRRIMLGSFVLSSGFYDAYYLKALKVQELIRRAYASAFEKYDLILGPVAPTAAPKIGENLSDPIKMYLSDIYTVSANLAGIPGISLPCGKTKEGLPIGMQLMAAHCCEDKMIRGAYAFEKGAENG